MATTIDIPCPKCGEPVMGEPLSGKLHDLIFFKFTRSNFRIKCACGFKKTYRFVSAEKLAQMYEPPSPK